MAHSRHHSPLTGSGRESRHSSGAKAPTGYGASWPNKDAAKATGNHRRKAKPLHPDCSTDTTPHRELVFSWLREGLTCREAADLVRTTLNGDAVAVRALDIYRKMKGELA